MLSTPIPQRPSSGQPGGLERAARPLDVSPDVWRGGVNFKPSCGGGVEISGCDPHTKTVQQSVPNVEFEPRSINTPVYECDLTNRDLVEIAARQAMTRNRSSALAQLLQDSGGVNPDLETNAIDITPATPSSFAATFQGLIEAMNACGLREIVLHVPAGYETYLIRDSVIEYEMSSGLYYAGPHLVIVDDYDPLSGPGGATPPVVDGSQVWVWATTPVELGLGEEMMSESVTVAANTHRITIEQHVMLLFDPCCVYAAVAQVC